MTPTPTDVPLDLTDPITQAYRAIWSALLADDGPSGFACLVGLKNRNDLSDKRFINTPPGVVLPGDLPEVTLLQGSFQMTPFGRNSRVTEIQQTFDLSAVIDKLHVEPLNKIKFRVLLALARAGIDLGLPFVRDWDITSATDAANSTAPLLSTAGMSLHLSSILHIRVSLCLDRAVLATL